MLVLHSSSRCDVCLSEYSWESTGKRPHAIACGHIFCRDCLYANSPPLCPLCRKLYQPNKMKKLHVDRPENIDDHKEIDLLQRLAISWETAPEQLEEVTTEVDVWLRDRADDACIALRKARAALAKTQKLEQSEASLQDTIAHMQERMQILHDTLIKERTLAIVQTEGYKTMIDGLTKDVVALKVQLEGAQALTHRYTHNPLPRPPEPIPTDQVPTFEQAVSESGMGMRVIELPSSPRRYPEPIASPHRYPYEMDSKSHRKGKSRSKHYDEASYRSSPSIQQQQQQQQQQTVHSPQNGSSSYVPAYLSSSRASTLQSRLDNTAQPLDQFSLMGMYLKEFSAGFVNGQQVAARSRTSTAASPQEYPGRSYTALPAEAGPSRHSSVQPTAAYESSRHGSANSMYQHRHHQSSDLEYSRRSETTRPYRQEAPPSIISSSTSSLHHDRSRSGSPHHQSRPRSRTGTGASASAAMSPAPPIGQVQPLTIVPPPASMYSTPPPDPPVRTPSRRESRESAGPASPVLLLSPTVPQSQLQVTQAEAQQRAPSIVSVRTHRTVLSSDTWGTAPLSNLESGSLISGLRAFAAGAEPVMLGGQEAPVFGELGSDGASVRTRASFSEPSGGPGAGAGDTAGLGLEMSPPREIVTMVGVLPPEEDPAVASYTNSSSRLAAANDAAYRSPTAVDPRAQYGWGMQQNSDSAIRNGSGRSRNGFGSASGYQTDSGDRSSYRHQRQHEQSASGQWNISSSRRDDRPSSGTYRSPTSADHYRDHRGELLYPRGRERERERERSSHASAASSAYSSRNDDDRRHSSSHSHSHSRSQSYYRHDDNRSIASSDRYSRSSGASRAPPIHTRGHHLPLPEESPFPLTVESTDDDDDDDEEDEEQEEDEEGELGRRHAALDRQQQHRTNRHRSHRDSRGSGSRSGRGSAPAIDASSGTVESESFGNALGLQLTTGSAPLSAPSPNVASLRSWNREH